MSASSTTTRNACPSMWWNGGESACGCQEVGTDQNPDQKPRHPGDDASSSATGPPRMDTPLRSRHEEPSKSTTHAKLSRRHDRLEEHESFYVAAWDAPAVVLTVMGGEYHLRLQRALEKYSARLQRHAPDTMVHQRVVMEYCAYVTLLEYERKKQLTSSGTKVTFGAEPSNTCAQYLLWRVTTGSRPHAIVAMMVERWAANRQVL
ncbi:hypothetical protein CERZMDRAFT_97035 [Cercospora zeae-maydis SCOH1-5]|uniref:Uncharacterized protein n=1 Tax=Cercospora zeae-maydis SCOH1-5 TaxID=717836 RepID=A0A6A6FGG2_9PEZI|nr:hypothetical protein CERZMDRAFT_97035 [Cercospora zeae-maydis SCOH1-5]